MWISNVAKVFHRGFLNATRHIFYWICCLYLSFQRLYKVFYFTAEFSSKHVNYGIWLSFCTVMAVKTLHCVVIFTNIDTNWLVLIFIKFYVQIIFEFLNYLILNSFFYLFIFFLLTSGCSLITIRTTIRSSHRGCSVEKVVLEMSQNSHENTCARVSLLTLLKKRLWHRCLHVNFAKFLKTTFPQNTSGRLLLNHSRMATSWCILFRI